MANSYKGKIEYVEPIQSIQRQGKEPFQKRRLMLDATRYDGITGERGYEKHVIFEFSGKNVGIPDSFKVGDVVEVSFDVESYKGTKKDGTQDWFTTVKGYKIDKVNIKPAVPQGGMAASQFPPQQNVPQGAPMGGVSGGQFPPQQTAPQGGMMGGGQFPPSGGGQDSNAPF